MGCPAAAAPTTPDPQAQDAHWFAPSKPAAAASGIVDRLVPAERGREAPQAAISQDAATAMATQTPVEDAEQMAFLDYPPLGDLAGVHRALDVSAGRGAAAVQGALPAPRACLASTSGALHGGSANRPLPCP